MKDVYGAAVVFLGQRLVAAKARDVAEAVVLVADFAALYPDTAGLSKADFSADVDDELK